MEKKEYTHQSVLLDEVLQALKLQPDGIYIDATFGRGGHSKAILQHLGEQGRLFAFDKDPGAIAAIDNALLADRRFSLQQGSYTMLGQLTEENGLQGRVNGILFDLGVASPQFDDPERGFSFQHDGPLDMRMDNSSGMTAAEWLAGAGQDEISRVLYEFGEERYSRRIARAIVKTRQECPIASTRQLADLVANTIPLREKDKHPATRTFQAIRILINDELSELQKVLAQTVDALAVGGRLLVISFHSLEDRLVKRFIRDESRGDRFPPDVPVTQDALQPRLKPVGKAIRPTENEIKKNPRSRSAVLRVAEKITA